MTENTENYIVLKPIAERFSRIANEMTDSDIERLIKKTLIIKLEEAIDFNAVSEIIDTCIEDNRDKISNAIIDSLVKKLELPENYRLY